MLLWEYNSLQEQMKKILIITFIVKPIEKYLTLASDLHVSGIVLLIYLKVYTFLQNNGAALFNCVMSTVNAGMIGPVPPGQLPLQMT